MFSVLKSQRNHYLTAIQRKMKRSATEYWSWDWLGTYLVDNYSFDRKAGICPPMTQAKLVPITTQWRSVVFNGRAWRPPVPPHGWNHIRGQFWSRRGHIARPLCSQTHIASYQEASTERRVCNVFYIQNILSLAVTFPLESSNFTHSHASWPWPFLSWAKLVRLLLLMNQKATND